MAKNFETKICQNCKQQFRIEPEDFVFYEKMKVPPPTFCPQCRLQRRLAWRNEVGLHRRKCDLCKEGIVATYPADAPFPVYCRECWWGDAWDGREHGLTYDWSKPFFSRFFELQKRVPQIALQVTNSVNCDFANQIVDCRNCYLIASAGEAEDCYYGHRILKSRNIVDCSLVVRCETCYQCVECQGVSYGAYIQNCVDAMDLSFCYDVRGSEHCFMSSNLRRAAYVFRNKRLGRDEYEKAMREVDLGSYQNIRQYKKEFADLVANSIHAYADMKNCVDSTGQILTNAKSSRNCFRSSDLENCSYMLYVDGAKDCMDVSIGTLERGYEISTGGIKSANVLFSTDVWPEVRDIAYCASCRNGSRDLFGCIGLKKGQYCILNKQYTEKEYTELLPRIIRHMHEMPYKDGKGRIYAYGEFFPAELSHSPYNESQAQDYFSLTKDEAGAERYPWRDPENRSVGISKHVADLPDHIKDISESVLQEIIGCEHAENCNERCTAGYRITPFELEFYKKRNIALPRLCPNCRNYERLRQQNPVRLWHGRCMCQWPRSAREGGYRNRAAHFHGSEKCPNEFETSYPPESAKLIYCESCYQTEVA